MVVESAQSAPHPTGALMRITIKIDTEVMGPSQLDEESKRLRGLADLIDPIPKRAREVAEAPYHAPEEGNDESPLQTLQREVEAAAKGWREKYLREFLIVSAPHYTAAQRGEYPKSTVHVAGEHFSGTELAHGGTITKGLTGA